MTTLILFASKYGAARDIAGRLARELGAGAPVDLAADGVPAPQGYDRVIIGSSVYAGRLRKEARTYVEQHRDALLEKPLGLFLSGIDPEAGTYLTSNYPAEIVDHAQAKAMLGGRFDPARASFFERLVMRLVAKVTAVTDTVSDDKIRAFAGEMNA